MADQKERSGFPKLELEKFDFSPPGPMGWSFSEYEQIIDNPEALSLSAYSTFENTMTFKGKKIFEFPLNSRQSALSPEVSPIGKQVAKGEESSSKELMLTSGSADQEAAVEMEPSSEEPILESEAPIADPWQRVKIVVENHTTTPPWLSPVFKKNAKVRNPVHKMKVREKI